MSKSRKRRRTKHPRRPHRPRGHVSGPSWAPTLTARERALWRARERAELSGDVATALRLYRQIGPVGGSDHEDMLEQLVEHEAVLPDWVRARWLTALALRLDSPLAEERHHEALEAAIVTAYAEDPAGRRLPDDPAGVLARLMARNWVYRQMFCYQLGGLAETLSVASPELVAASGPVDQWVEAELGGYRLESLGNGVATLRDLVSGTQVDILDIGTCGELEIGDHSIGRLVPINESPGFMAESRLVPVPETAAVEIAWAPESWLDTVAWLATEARSPRFSDWDPGSLCSDVPELVWRLLDLPEDVTADSPELIDAHGGSPPDGTPAVPTL